MQARIDAKLEQTSAAGPEAHESVNALENRQPTPGSIAAAESKLGELSPKTVKVVASAMALARMADQADNRKACQRALEDVERALGP